MLTRLLGDPPGIASQQLEQVCVAGTQCWNSSAADAVSWSDSEHPACCVELVVQHAPSQLAVVARTLLLHQEETWRKKTKILDHHTHTALYAQNHAEKPMPKSRAKRKHCRLGFGFRN